MLLLIKYHTDLPSIIIPRLTQNVRNIVAHANAITVDGAMIQSEISFSLPHIIDQNDSGKLKVSGNGDFSINFCSDADAEMLYEAIESPESEILIYFDLYYDEVAPENLVATTSRHPSQITLLGIEEID